MAPLRVLVVSADPLARGGLAALLSGQPGLSLVAQAAPGPELRAALAGGAPDVVVWDLGADGNASRLGEAEGLPVLAVLGSAEQAAEALAAGARGLVLRDASPERLAAAAGGVGRGLWALDAALAPALLRPAAAAPHEPLTRRELEVLGLLAEGLSNKAIAARLGISEHTAKFHVNAILGKLGAESRSEAIVRAARMGLVAL